MTTIEISYSYTSMYTKKIIYDTIAVCIISVN